MPPRCRGPATPVGQDRRRKPRDSRAANGAPPPDPSIRNCPARSLSSRFSGSLPFQRARISKPAHLHPTERINEDVRTFNAANSLRATREDTSCAKRHVLSSPPRTRNGSRERGDRFGRSIRRPISRRRILLSVSRRLLPPLPASLFLRAKPGDQNSVMLLVNFRYTRGKRLLSAERIV